TRDRQWAILLATNGQLHDRPWAGSHGRRHMSDITTSAAPLLDVNQVAERLCVSPRFVRRLIDERRIPFCKLGKFVRFEPGDVDAWVTERRVEAVRR
ncbi:helix-turn-helix domain-containing protein, partial [Ilumatobacter sp.]|uniref:helix-turn-helix domain-containing protein n=1 Tax=Ilumatobacter sp. TaxID=1967498 RepID=UPI003750AC5F